MTAPARGTAWSEFRAGLLEPSAPALGLTLATAALALVAAISIFTEDFVARLGPRYLLSASRDFDVLSSSRVLALQRTPVDRPFVILLGTSLMGAAVRQQWLTDDLAAAGKSPQMFKLCTARQSLTESLAFADLIPDGATGVVVLGIGPGALANSREALLESGTQDRLGFRSAAYDAELARFAIAPRRRTGLYAVDNAGFLLARLNAVARNALTGRAPFPDDFVFSSRPYPSDDDFHEVGREMSRRLADYWKQQDFNRDALDRLIGETRGRTKLTWLLLETPVNPRFVEEYDAAKIFADHRAHLREFAAARGIGYVDLNEAAALQRGDFHDWGHLHSDDAVRRTTAVASRAIAERLP